MAATRHFLCNGGMVARVTAVQRGKAELGHHGAWLGRHLRLRRRRPGSGRARAAVAIGVVLLAVEVSDLRIGTHGWRICLQRPDLVSMTYINDTGMTREDLARVCWLDFQTVEANINDDRC